MYVEKRRLMSKFFEKRRDVITSAYVDVRTFVRKTVSQTLIMGDAVTYNFGQFWWHLALLKLHRVTRAKTLRLVELKKLLIF